MIMLGLLSMLFGCKKESQYPFDVEKAYRMSRGGIIAGGSYEIKTDPEGIVEVYSYPEKPPKNEGGMSDKGADIYFVGIKQGRTVVTVKKFYPTAKPEEFSFGLSVSEDLRVSKMEFDIEKAFYMRRGGIITGGGYEIKTEPEGKVEIHSYIIPAPEDEDGMRDCGADIYFVGLEQGKVTVTVREYYPTSEPEEYSFILIVGEDLSVLKRKQNKKYIFPPQFPPFSTLLRFHRVVTE